MSTNSQGFAEITLNETLKTLCPAVDFEAVWLLKSEVNPASQDLPKPSIKVSEIDFERRTKFFVQVRVQDHSQAEEATWLAAAKLFHRATSGKERGPVPEDVTVRMQQAYRSIFREDSETAQAYINAVAFLIQAFKEKKPPTLLPVTVTMKDGSERKFKVSIKDAGNALAICADYTKLGAVSIITSLLGEDIPLLDLLHQSAAEAQAA